MKRFVIYTARSDGRYEIYNHTNLASEVLRFEELGYHVVDTAGTDEGVAS